MDSHLPPTSLLGFLSYIITKLNISKRLFKRFYEQSNYAFKQCNSLGVRWQDVCEDIEISWKLTNIDHPMIWVRSKKDDLDEVCLSVTAKASERMYENKVEITKLSLSPYEKKLRDLPPIDGVSEFWVNVLSKKKNGVKQPCYDDAIHYFPSTPLYSQHWEKYWGETFNVDFLDDAKDDFKVVLKTYLVNRFNTRGLYREKIWIDKLPSFMRFPAKGLQFILTKKYIFDLVFWSLLVCGLMFIDDNGNIHRNKQEIIKLGLFQ